LTKIPLRCGFPLRSSPTSTPSCGRSWSEPGFATLPWQYRQPPAGALARSVRCFIVNSESCASIRRRRDDRRIAIGPSPCVAGKP
jgi:hypothetical protein